MASQTLSQIAYQEQNSVRAIINEKGDTLIEMSLNDAKVVARLLVEKEFHDSLLVEYIGKDSVNTNIITLQAMEIFLLEQKQKNNEDINGNLNEIIRNKDRQIYAMGEIMNVQHKEINKQKRWKVFGFIAAAVLPVATLFTVLGIR
jgi:hypothetical protein